MLFVECILDSCEQYFLHESLLDTLLDTGMRWNIDKVRKASVELGVDIKKHLNLPIADLDEDGSRFFKAVYTNPTRLEPLVRESDVEYTIED